VRRALRSALLGLAVSAAAVGACKAPAPAPLPDASAVAGPRVLDVGPRLISNATQHVVTILGDGFTDGMVVSADGTPLKTTRVAPNRLHAVVPAGTKIPAGTPEHRMVLTVAGAQGSVELGVANDTAFVQPVNMTATPDGARVFVSATHADQVWSLERASGVWSRLPTQDGPRGMAMFQDAQGGDWLVVVHEHAPVLRMMRVGAEAAPVDIPVTAHAADVAVVGGMAWVTNHQLRAVEVVDLVARRVVATHPVGEGPNPLVAAGDRVVVANHLSEDLSVLDASGTQQRVVPGPGTPILGGRTETFSDRIMGGKRTRGLGWDSKSGRVLAGTLGPNIGPNPERMEVTMNGGLSVIDVQKAQTLRHVGLGGVAEGVAVDARARVAFAALVSTGTLVAVDVDRLVSSDKAARTAELARLELVAPASTPRIRPREELGVQGRATDALHTGPRALHLVDGGKTLLVLNRLSRTLDEVDVSAVRKGGMKVVRTHPLPDAPEQTDRWLGEITYFTDVGRSGMSCDACHPDGHTGGMLFTKGRPMQVYRSSTMRASRDTAPYFTPQRTPSLEAMSTQVLAHNRFENPPSSPLEIRTLTQFTGLHAAPPNPYLGPDGALPTDLTLPDGAHGNPQRGMMLFDGDAGCSSKLCHPPPIYTADQDPETRARFHDVGTPQFLPLREEMQDKRGALWPPVSLLGAWDQFPFLASGAGGYTVSPEGTLRAVSRFPLRDALQAGTTAKHGLLNALTEQDRNDVLAFVQTL
jgi:hypothetical protein